MIRKFIFIFLFCALFCINASANTTDIYKQQLENSGIYGLEDSLSDEVKEYLKEYSIDVSDYNWVNNLTTKNVFSHIFAFLKGGIKTPLISAGAILAIILLSAILSEQNNDSVSKTVMFATTLSVAGVISIPILESISAAVSAMKGSAVFMTAFVPIFGVIVAAGGRTATSISMSSLLLGAANGVSFIANFAVVPLMSGYLSIGITSSVSDFFNSNGISAGIKKFSFWIMSFISTVFIGILSLQTAVNASADTLTMKTAKFIIGSSVPVAGGVLSEALNTLTASMSLLKSSVGIYGVVICCLIFLPILLELLLWRVCIWFTDFIAGIFSVPKISGLLQSIDTVLSVLIGVILLTGAMFIISLTVIVGSGKT